MHMLLTIKLNNTVLQVTLEEFSALMKGELSGRDPMEAVIAIFMALSRPDGDSRFNGFITLSKLRVACRDFSVLIARILLFSRSIGKSSNWDRIVISFDLNCFPLQYCCQALQSCNLSLPFFRCACPPTNSSWWSVRYLGAMQTAQWTWVPLCRSWITLRGTRHAAHPKLRSVKTELVKS